MASEHTGTEKLYTFTVTEQVLNELKEIADIFRKRFIDRKFKSLEILWEINEIPVEKQD